MNSAEPLDYLEDSLADLLATRLEASEKAIIEETLAACEGFVARAARVLSLSRTGLISRMATLQIEADEFRRRRREG